MSQLPGHPIPQAAGFSTPIPEAEARATFGWRPGAIRGLLSLMVLALLWSVALFSPEWSRDHQIPSVYVYLQYLLVLIIAYYFPPHGSINPETRGEPSKHRIWPGIVPYVMVVGSIGLGVWVYLKHKDIHFAPQEPLALLYLLGGFLIGHAITWFLSGLAGGRLPVWMQDLQAWVALVGIVGLAAELVVQVFILEGLERERREEIRATLAQFEGIVAGVVAFYYGARTETPRVSS